MLARPKIVSGDSARNYFEMDTYYLNNEFEQGLFYEKLKEDLDKNNDRKRAALNFTESNCSFAKSRDKKEGVKAEPKMVFARFDHSESRNNDMHLHQHCLMLNFVNPNNEENQDVG